MSFYGDEIEQGIEAYVEQVNAKGGINGRTIKLVKLDNAASESQAATNETQLLTADKAISVFGSVLSTDCTASTAAADRYQVPTSCESEETPNPYIYSLGADDSTDASAMLAAAAKITGKAHPTIAVVTIDTLTDIQMAKNIIKAASAAGDKVVTSQEISLTATDYSVPVSKIAAAKPDAVAISETGPGFDSVLKGLQSSGLTVPMLYADGTGNLSSLTGLTASNVYAMGSTPIVDPSSTNSQVEAYVAALKAAGVKPSLATVSGITQDAYLAAAAFGQALKTCGSSCTGPKLAAALNTTHLALGPVDGSYSYSATNHLPFPTWYVYHLAGGKFTPDGTYPADS